MHHMVRLRNIDSPVYSVDVWLFEDNRPVSFSDFSVVAYCAGQ
jgi:hypothetical protein